ncbi:hypothetical protein BHM03_00039956 [Ensete ventricosum]|nr:hypothetical protein BHM03_00039956 [Ensete ventricosum]
MGEVDRQFEVPAVLLGCLDVALRCSTSRCSSTARFSAASITSRPDLIFSSLFVAHSAEFLSRIRRTIQPVS